MVTNHWRIKVYCSGNDITTFKNYPLVTKVLDSSVRSEVARPAGMLYEWLAVTFQGTMVSQSNSRLVAEDCPGFPPP